MIESYEDLRIVVWKSEFWDKKMEADVCWCRVTQEYAKDWHGRNGNFLEKMLGCARSMSGFMPYDHVCLPRANDPAVQLICKMTLKPCESIKIPTCDTAAVFPDLELRNPFFYSLATQTKQKSGHTGRIGHWSLVCEDRLRIPRLVS